ncbi:MAG: tRNA uridine(34) 5-carboxymethylaminomethyl modification radical SAM/GNAT enzyme Elp3, partial [Candidatus Parcubacteria bacterium]|nr:tRNA uridine(34) 5-carboxymethylaminomethyl modification radical SAM/GNAT enzyme Elp3 [Candidatus Parcubacteria bacterium]
VGITIETRPDYINEKEIKRLRQFGVTRVELGIQSIYDDVLKLNRRGHGVKETILATCLLKDAGFKICYQMMPNLPGSNLKRDEKMFKEIFSNPDFQPDLLKIYPCALLKEAPLYRVWKKMDYKPYSEKQLISLIAAIKKEIPFYCRIQRIIRDFPSDKVAGGGAKISNLRQYLLKLQKDKGWKCRCIRCREVKGNYNPKEKIYLFREDYAASGGKEIFLSFENKTKEKLFSLLRLRTASEKVIFPSLSRAAIIREIHTYGQLYPLSPNDGSVISPQHKGLGKEMIKEAEKIVKKEFGLKKIAAIAGVGSREYFRKLGYSLKEEYMIKKL